MNNLVTLRGVRVTLGEHPILKGVDFGLARGKITALIGLNGSGKSTLLRALVKEVPYTGQIKFHCGHDHTKPTPEHVGYVPQKLQIDANLPLTVYDLFGLALQRRPQFLGVGKATRQRIHELLERVGMLPRLHEPPVAKLSGGQLQRVLLALALHPEPELLLLDEPAAGIDFKDQDSFYRLIASLNQSMGITVLLVSHDLSVVSELSDHVLCLNDGLIQCQGTPHEILNGANLKQIFGDEKAIYVHGDGHNHEHHDASRSGEKVRITRD